MNNLSESNKMFGTHSFIYVIVKKIVDHVSIWRKYFKCVLHFYFNFMKFVTISRGHYNFSISIKGTEKYIVEILTSSGNAVTLY